MKKNFYVYVVVEENWQVQVLMVVDENSAIEVVVEENSWV